MGTNTAEEVTPERISFVEVEEDFNWQRGGAPKQPNPYIADIKALWEENQKRAAAGEKGKTLQAVVAKDGVDELVRKLRAAGRENGCTILVDKSNPNKQGQVAVRFTAREKIVKNKGGGGAPTT